MRLLSRPSLLILVALLAVGLVVRVVLAFTTYGVAYDIHSYEITARALRSAHSGVYDGVRWPYPGGFLPLLAACDWLSRHLGIRFDGIVQLPAILADLGLSLLAAAALRWRGTSERRALAGAALVALGPSFIVISGYHGQIDAVGALPALAGVLVWTRGGARRALYAGLLIGLGASVKQPLGFAVLALMPTAHSWRERGTALAGAIAVPLLSILPFLIKSPDNTLRAMGQNSGVPGFGGLSAFVQPSLTHHVFTQGPFPPISSATHALLSAQRGIVLMGVLAATALLWRRHVPALPSASFIWLALYVLNPNFGFEYLIWGLPFFIAAGYLGAVAVFQAAILPATLWLYWRPGLDPGGWSYFVAVQAVWLGLLATLVVQTRRLLRYPGRSLTRRAGTPA